MIKKYEKYKESGIEWLGEIPENWKINKLKYLLSLNDETLGENTADDYLIQYVEISDVNQELGIHNSTLMPFIEAPSRARRKVKSGDVIVSTVRTYLKAIARIKDCPDNLIVSTGFAVLRPKSIDSNFLGYLMISDEIINEIISNSVGVSYPAINASQLIKIPIPVPTVSEQTQIASFLDQQTTIIDDLIGQKEKLITLLKEKRQAIINEAVTKGLNPNAKMKDSGIVWLGEVPEEWVIGQLKHLGEIKGRIGFKGYSVSDLVDEDTKGRAIVLGGTNVMKSGNLSYEKLTFLSEFKYLESPEIMLKGGEILITKVGAGVGENAIYSFHSERVTINPNVMIFVPNSKTNAEFINFFLLSDFVKRNMLLESRKSGAQPAINQSFLKNIRIALPSLDEQVRIVNYLDERNCFIESIIDQTTLQITKLKDYRQSLISEVVTGKIDVRDWKPANN